MFVTRLKLKNWRNFREVNVPIHERTYLIGPNAAGKSNFLDVFRFLRDISKPRGGGLQQAIAARGGIKILRCLHSRKDPEVRIEVHLSENLDDGEPEWRYILAFKAEGKGAQRVLVTSEEVWKRGKSKAILKRPNESDLHDDVQLTETYIEHLSANKDFRDISTFFSDCTYLHLVPQLLKYNDMIGGKMVESDPFGQGFLQKIAKSTTRIRDSRLKKIETALALAVPQFKNLRFIQDEVTGMPHIEAQYSHHRPNAGWQREEHFSDGTLRLIGLLWSLLDGYSLLLLEEPELSLHEGIVKQIPALIESVLSQNTKRYRQLIISTHSTAMLSNPGIDGRGVLVFAPTGDGTKIREINDEERTALNAGFSVADVILPNTKPENADLLGNWR